MTRRRHRIALLALVALALLLVGCGSDDGGSAPDTGGGFSLRSAAFGEGDDIPPEHAYDGGNVSPPLQWSGVPTDAEELALTVVDPDASNFVHWVVWGIDPTDGEIGPGQSPPGAVVGTNQFGEPGWGGPQPPAGEEHTYVFALHALSRPPAIDDTASAIEAVAAIEQVTTATAELRGQYTSP